MVLQHNLPALNSYRRQGMNNKAIAKNLEKLSSGYRINRAGDDAAGLAISEKMRGQIRGLDMAEMNTQHAIKLLQTAEGGLNETHAILQRMRELAVQASNGTYQDEDRAQLELEFQAVQSEVDRIADYTHYNGIKLLTTETVDSSTGPSGPGGATGPTAPQAPTSPVTICGDFTVYGDTSNFTYDAVNRVLTVVDSGVIAIEGTTTEDRIVIQDGVTANVILRNANIDVSSLGIDGCALDVDGAAVLNLTLLGDNTLKSYGMRAGIEVTKNATLVITEASTGSITAITEGWMDARISFAAAIGGSRLFHPGDENFDADCGTVIINGGTVNAMSATIGAGIGGAYEGIGGTIIINGGIVTATAGYAPNDDGYYLISAGIGSGGIDGIGYDDDYTSVIVINGGTVIAISTGAGAGIGCGSGGYGFDITINGGTIIATSKSDDFTTHDGGGAGIGGGYETGATPLINGKITINGGTITATGSGGGAGIGGGEGSATFGGDITITGGDITAVGGEGAFGIGAGRDNTIPSTFSTGTNGSADITISNDDGDTDLADLLSDTSGMADWDCWINGVQYGNPGAGGTGGGTGGGDGTGGDDDGDGGDTSATLYFQVGANKDENIIFQVKDMGCKSLGIDTISVLTRDEANAAIEAIDGAINYVSSHRAYIGSLQNRLEHTLNNLGVTKENLISAESSIRDLDMAKEYMDFTKNNILVQASQAMLAQANQLPQGVLQILQ